jgi:hypothetical protein
MRLDISTQKIADMVVDIRQEQEAQRKRIAEIQDAQAAAARDADNGETCPSLHPILSLSQHQLFLTNWTPYTLRSTILTP